MNFLRLLMLIVILMWQLSNECVSSVEVDLTVTPTFMKKSVIQLCQNDRRTVFLECVAISLNVEWTFNQFELSSVRYSQLDPTGIETKMPPISVILIQFDEDGSNSNISSQVHFEIPAVVELMRNTEGMFRVTCSATLTIKKSIFFEINRGECEPNITSAIVNGNTGKMIIEWSACSNNGNIFTASIKTSNDYHNFSTTVRVDLYRGHALSFVSPFIDHNVTIEIVDQCGEVYESDPFSATIVMHTPTPIPTPIPTSIPTPTSTPSCQDSSNDSECVTMSTIKTSVVEKASHVAALIAVSVLLFMCFTIFVLAMFICFVIRRKRISEVSKVGMRRTEFQIDDQIISVEKVEKEEL